MHYPSRSREQYDKALAVAIRDILPCAHEGWKADLSCICLQGATLEKVRMTDDPAALIEVSLRLDPDGRSRQEVAQELEAIWVDDLVHRGTAEEHALTITDAAVILEAFTLSRNKQYYVSVKVVVNMRTPAA